MKNKMTITLLSVFIGFFHIGCNNINEQKQSLKKEELQANIIANKLCFRNEYLFKDNPVIKDVVELMLLIEGEKVTGTYNWLPAEKDQRKGSFTGTINGNMIIAQYSFLQEGIENTTELSIKIYDEKAEITGGALELGLNVNITKIDCDKY